MSNISMANVLEDLDTNDLSSEQLTKLNEMLKVQQTQKKLAAKNEGWERGMKVRNPGLVLGSLRVPTDAELEMIGVSENKHGLVCSIECQFEGCDVVRTIFKQDAFQSRYCKPHVTEARKGRNKAKKAAEQMEKLKKNPEELKAMLTALLDSGADLADILGETETAETEAA